MSCEYKVGKNDHSWEVGYEKGYMQGRADAIDEYHLKLLNCQTTKVKSIHDAEIWVEFKRQSTKIAEQLKEQK